MMKEKREKAALCAFYYGRIHMADVMRRILKRKLQASYTAEAAVLIPVGFAVVLLIVSFTLICYDRTALCAGIHEAAQREAFQKMRDGDREETEMPAAVSEVFLTTEDRQRHISVRGEARSRFLSDLIASVFFLPEAGYENEETVFLIYGENQVRQNRAGENEIGESD